MSSCSTSNPPSCSATASAASSLSRWRTTDSSMSARVVHGAADEARARRAGPRTWPASPSRPTRCARAPRSAAPRSSSGGGGSGVGAAAASRARRRGLLPRGAALLDEGRAPAPGRRSTTLPRALVPVPVGRHGEELQVARGDAGGLPGEGEQVPAARRGRPTAARPARARPASPGRSASRPRGPCRRPRRGRPAGGGSATGRPRAARGAGGRTPARRRRRPCAGRRGSARRTAGRRPAFFRHTSTPADGAGQVVEAEQVDLGVVVDGDAGEPLDGPDQRGPAGLRGLGVDPRAVADALVDEPLGGQRLHAPGRRH